MPEARGQVVLAFDFGLRRIGIASGDSLTGSAAPQEALLVGDRGIDWSAIGHTLKQYQPALLVVGRPRNADGTASSIAEASDRFAAALAERTGLPVLRSDEYASSL